MDQAVESRHTQFKHEPVQPPREGVKGEHVFCDAWRAYMTPESTSDEDLNSKLGAVLFKSAVPLTQRAATVAASLITWLGCRRGSDLLYTAEDLAKKQGCPDKAYLSAWVLQNVRDSAVNHGFTTLEVVLAPAGVGPALPYVTTADLEVAEHVMLWLGCDQGQKFLSTCEAEIRRQEHVESFTRHLTFNLGLSPSAVVSTLRMAAQYQPEPIPFFR